MDRFSASSVDEQFYLIISALVPYKRVDLAVEVFNANGKQLVIAGTGPESEKLQSMAKPNIKFLGWRSDEELVQLYSKCTALIFPGEEDFGIVPLEATASGKPVVAYGKGGALETIVDGKTGVFFSEQTVSSLNAAIELVQTIDFNPEEVRNYSMQFSRLVFKQKMQKFIEEKIQHHAVE